MRHPPEQACANCLHSVLRLRSGIQVLECHKQPPSALLPHYWLPIAPEEWCGNWTAEPVEQKYGTPPTQAKGGNTP